MDCVPMKDDKTIEKSTEIVSEMCISIDKLNSYCIHYYGL